jgi:ABC-2 type transport system permease protein
MFEQVRFSIGAYLRLLAGQIRSQMQYRLSFFLDATAAMIFLGLFFLALALTLQRFGNLGGWTLGEIAFLWGVVEVSFGLMDMIFSGFDPQNFGNRIRQGHFDKLLLRPVNLTVQVLGDDFALRRLGRIAQGFIIFGVALNLADIQWTLGKLVYLPLVIGGMVAFFGGLFVIGATITFWTIESIEVMNVLTYGGSEMMQYPMHIYPDLMRRFFTFVIPAIFLNYYPALYFLDKPDPLGFPTFLRFISPLIGVGILLLGLAFWRFGIRHYQSTGT